MQAKKTTRKEIKMFCDLPNEEPKKEKKEKLLNNIKVIVKYFNGEGDVSKVEDIIDEHLNFAYAEKQDAYKLASEDKWNLWSDLTESCAEDEYGGLTLEDADWLEGWMDDYSEACEFIEKAENELRDALDTLYSLVDEEKEEELWNELYDLAIQYAPNAFNWREERRIQHEKEASGYY